MLLSPRRALVKVCATLMMTFVLMTIGVVDGPPSEAARRERYSFNRLEKCMLKKINKRRARNGHRRLDWDRQLGYVARRHSRAMARNRTIFHDHNLGQEITRWRRLGQNVGMGGRCRSLFKAFWRSSSHRSNILGSWRFVGVGAERRRGRIYVHHVFEARRNPGNIYSRP